MLIKSIIVLRYLGLFSVTLLSIVAIFACAPAPYVSDKNTNLPSSTRNEFQEKYYKNKTEHYKERYKKRYGSVDNHDTTSESYKAELAAQQQKIIDLQETLKKIEESRESLQNELSGVQKDRIEQQKIVAKSASERERLEKDLETSHEQIQELSQTKGQLIAQSTETRKQLEQELAAVQEKLKSVPPPHLNTIAKESNDPLIESQLRVPPKLNSIIDIDSLGEYHALIIGNNSYQDLPLLKTAINDAQVIAEILKRDYGYNVQVLLNATRANILLTLEKYRSRLTEDDNLLIYYAGHGWLDQMGDEGYWLPVDASGNNPINWISNSSITTYLKAIGAKHVMVVADSCYSGKLSRGFHLNRKTPDYLSRLSQKKARVVLTSGGLEPVTDSGGKDNHSVFASALIDALNENQDIIDGTELFTKIRRQVMLNSEQTPEYSDIRKAGHDGGDFVFFKTEISNNSD